MKRKSIFTAVILGLLVIALGLAVYVWAKLQSLPDQALTKPVVESSAESANETPLDENTVADTESSADVQAETPAPVSSAPVLVVDEPIVIDPATLSSTQRKTLELVGVDTSTDIIVTPTMVDCAEGKLGTERFSEIVGGSTPGPIEVAQLATCL